MKIRRHGSRVFVRLERGESVHPMLATLAEREKIRGGFFSGLGAIRDPEIGFYDLERRAYDRRRFDGEFEVGSLTGTLSIADGVPHVHMHAVLSDRECRALAGHVFAMTVGATVEIHIDVSDTEIERTADEETGLALWRVGGKEDGRRE